MKKIAVLLIVVMLFSFTGCGIIERLYEIQIDKKVPLEPEMATVKPTSYPLATIEPTPEPTPTLAFVKDGFTYKKEVIIPQKYKDMDHVTYNPHSIVIPEIVDDGTEVKILNDKMYALCKETLSMLQNNTEDDMLVNYLYHYTEHNGIFGININCNVGVMFSEWYGTYETFFYDSVNNKILTFDEYVSALGLTKDSAWQKIQNDSIYKDYFALGSAGNSLKAFIADKNKTIAIINTPNEYSEITWIELAPIL